MVINKIIAFFPAFICLAFFVFFLLKLKKNERGAASLSVFFFATLLLYLCHGSFFNGIYSPFLDTLYIALQLCVYPLFLVYLHKLTKIDELSPGAKPLCDRFRLIFIIPCVVTLLNIILYLAMTPEEASEFVNKYLYGLDYNYVTIWGKMQIYLHFASSVLFAVEVMVVLMVGLKMLVAYEKKLQDYYSDTSGRTLTSIKTFLIVFFVFSFFSIIASIIGKNFFTDSVLMLSIPSVIFGTLLFFVGYVGATITFSGEDILKEMPLEKEMGILSDRQFEEIKVRIDVLINTDKVFLIPDYKLSDMAKDAYTNRTYLSYVINKGYKCNFSQLINFRRIELAKSMINKGRALNDKNFISIIWEDAGFPSESSYYRIFKSVTGMTPSEYKQKNV
jgi:AraC-like DNA-binding protein